MIDVKNLSYSIGSRTLFEYISFYVPDGSTVGVIGANGCGKSTLFRLIQKEIFPDSGGIFIPNGNRLVSVRQEIADTSITLLDFILSADEELITLRKQSEIESDGTKLGEIFDKLEKIDAFNAEIRASIILAGLGFEQADFPRQLKEFSGGWQIRASLAATLFAPSEILLLDEPTNHLDFETIIWLKNYLKKLNKTILIISHDRSILNDLCDKILHMPSGKMYTGNYDNFVTTRAIQQEALKSSIQKQEAARKHMQAFIDRFRYKASKAKQAQSRIKMLEKMQSLPKLEQDYTVKFEFPNPSAIDRQLISLKHAKLGYKINKQNSYHNDEEKFSHHTENIADEFVVLRDVNLKIDAGDRIALLGANGNGKSTMVKVLSGRLPLLSGNIEFARNIKVAYFSQQQSDELDFQKTPYEILSEVLESTNETIVRAQLARFGLTQSKVETKVAKLSGGEKTRLLLAIVTRDAPHILILDEPTNHLDIEAKDALVDALNEYQGAVILVSHDFFVVESVCEQLFVISNHECRPFDGSLEDYMALVIDEKKIEKKEKKEQSQPTHKQQKISLRNQEKLKKEIKILEEKINLLSQKIEALRNQLNDNYTIAIYNELTDAELQLAELESQWLELVERCE